MRDLSFRSSRRGRTWKALVAIGMLIPLLGVPAQAEDPLDPVLGDPGRALPNLVPNVEDLLIQTFRFTDDGFTFENGLFLWFDTRAQNLGDVPLQITVDEVETPETSTVSQCVSWRSADAHVCRETEEAGGFEWHAAHNHFHYTDFARYELRTLAADGRPDYSDAGLLRVSEKVSFCLIDSERVQDDGSATQFYMTCLPTVQGVSPGWTDIYTADLEGQNFSIEGLSDGRYALIIDMNYAGTIQETDDTDDFLEATIELSDNLSEAAVVSRNWPAPDDRGTGTTATTTTTSTTSTTTPECAPPGKGKGKGNGGNGSGNGNGTADA